eukprot:g2461.t1
MDEINDGNSNNPLTLAELAYEVNSDIHKMLQDEEREAMLLQEEVQEEEERRKIQLEMQNINIGFEIQNVVVPIVEIFTMIDIDKCEHVEVDDLIMAIKDDSQLRNIFGKKALKKITSAIQIYAPPVKNLGGGLVTRIISKDQLFNIIIDRLPAIVKLIKKNQPLETSAGIYNDLVKNELYAQHHVTEGADETKLGHVLLEQSKRVKRRRASAIVQTPDTVKKLEKSTFYLQQGHHSKKTAIINNAIDIIREIDGLHKERENLDENGTLTIEDQRLKDTRIHAEITDLERELNEAIGRVPEIGQHIADWRLKHNRLMSRQTRHLTVSHHAKVLKKARGKVIDEFNTGTIERNKSLDGQFRNYAWDDRMLLGGISRPQSEYEAFYKKRRRASQSTRIRLKKSDLLDIQSNDNRKELYIHHNFDQLTKSNSSERHRMYKKKNETRIYNKEGYNDGRSRRRSMAVAVLGSNGDGIVTKAVKDKLSKQVNNYEYLRPRPTLRSKAIWTPATRQSELNDWYVPQQLVHNFNSDVIRPKEISKDSAAQRYLSKIMQKNKAVASNVFFKEKKEFEVDHLSTRDYEVDQEFY